LDEERRFPVYFSKFAIANAAENGPTYGNGDLVVFSRFNESEHLKALEEEKPYFIHKEGGKNRLTGSSSNRLTIAEIELW
jgi:hypothetical protein